MPISLENLFVEKQMVLEVAAGTQEEALREVAAILSRNEGMLDPGRFIEELLAREKQQSTAAGNGIAFPHARSEAVEAIMIATGRSREGVFFGKNKERVHFIFLIGTPKPMVGDYLVCIGALARLMKNSDLREDLMRAASARQLVEILKTAASSSL